MAVVCTSYIWHVIMDCFCFSSRRRHTICALVTGVQTCALPIYVDTRLLFYRRDILKRAGFDAPPVTWAEWRRQMVAIKALVGPGRYAAYFPLNEYEPLPVLGLQAPEPQVPAEGPGNFDSAGLDRKSVGEGKRVLVRVDLGG